jgi:hypothetical protein
MSSKWKKLKEFTVKHKKEVLDLIDKGVSQWTIAVQFDFAKSLIGNINENTFVILKAWEGNKN